MYRACVAAKHHQELSACTELSVFPPVNEATGMHGCQSLYRKAGQQQPASMTVEESCLSILVRKCSTCNLVNSIHHDAYKPSTAIKQAITAPAWTTNVCFGFKT
jgi:hypothetical protein